MQLYSFSIDKKTLNQLRSLPRTISVSGHIRLAITNYLEQLGNKPATSIGGKLGSNKRNIRSKDNDIF